MFRFRRIVGVALEDFGLARPAKAATETPVPVPGPLVELSVVTDLPPGIVWCGSVTRSPQLQRFCEHLEASRVEVRV